MATSSHEKACAIDGHHLGYCQDENGTQLPPTAQQVPRHEPGCQLGDHGAGLSCFPRIETTRMEVKLPPAETFPRRGPQPTAPGPYHATVRGPDGLDVNLSGEGQMFGRILGAIGDTLSAFLGD